MVIGSVSFWCSAKSSGCCSPSYSLPSTCVIHFRILDGVRKKWGSLPAFCTAGEAEWLSHPLTLWEKLWTKMVSLGTELCHDGEGLTWVKGNRSYPLWSPNLGYCFASVVCWNFSLRLPQRHSYPWVIVKVGFLCGEDGRKILFFHFDDITSQVNITLFTNINAVLKLLMLIRGKPLVLTKIGMENSNMSSQIKCICPLLYALVIKAATCPWSAVLALIPSYVTL